MEAMDDLASYERRFRRAGLPLFIEDYSATEDIFNRSVPLLGLVVIGEVSLALDEQWAWWANVLAILGGLAILLTAVGLVNRLRGRRFTARPERLGKTELVLFVLVPALLPLVFGGQARQAALTVVANLLVLGIVYLIVGYALVDTLRWAAVRVLGELTKSLAVLARAVPLLLVFSLLLVMTQEMWLVFGSLPVPFLALTGGLFLALGAVFLAARLPREVASLEQEVGTDGPPLRRRQRLNVGVVLFTSQALQVLIVSVAVGLFFVVFGTVAINEATQRLFLDGQAPKVLLTLDVFAREVVLTEQLLRLSVGLAAFSGLYYAIAVLNDSAYREEFVSDLTREMRDTFRLRAEYLERRRSVAGVDLRAFLPTVGRKR
jgi:hypothetical protein